jgi:hypothetical protein
MKTKRIGISGLILMWMCSSCSEHERSHHAVVLRALVEEGSGIGAVTSELRKEHQLPIGADAFLLRYNQAFALKWTIITNSSGVLEICRDGIPIWSIHSQDGVVQRIGGSSPEELALLPKFANVDFSQPLTESNMPSVGASEAESLRRESEQIWKYYFGTEGKTQ